MNKKEALTILENLNDDEEIFITSISNVEPKEIQGKLNLLYDSILENSNK